MEMLIQPWRSRFPPILSTTIYQREKGENRLHKLPLPISTIHSINGSSIYSVEMKFENIISHF